ncbi:hypothetical protein [Desulfonatronospira sp.]|uniref:hypothetical protein n=1 Tax=Desulfonatronospira sp. TaxID=1962951 RepID=UPI0025C16186|nr:hypothetical protein [Desulfonatronospira sp.]
MVVLVTVHFSGNPTQDEQQAMIQAAKSFAKDPDKVEVVEDNESRNKLTAVFRMKNEAAYKAVEKVWPRFKMSTPSRIDMSVRFEQEKAYDLRTNKR